MSDLITSLQNPRLKNAIKLRDRRGRDTQDRIIIDGARELSRALDANVYIVEVFYCPDYADAEDAVSRVVDRVGEMGVEVLETTPDVFEKLAYGDRQEGVVAVARTPRHSLYDFLLTNKPFVGVLEAVEKPGNIGAVIRTADAAGVSALVVADAGTDLYNPNVIRASLGTVFTLPVCTATSVETRAWLRSRGAKVFAARVGASQDYAQADYTGATAIVFGNEARGLSDVWSGDDVTAISLPMLGAADSLNVSATAAVLFYEALRQRQSRSR